MVDTVIEVQISWCQFEKKKRREWVDREENRVEDEEKRVGDAKNTLRLRTRSTMCA